MSARLKRLEEFKEHAWHGKQMKKLKTDELKAIVDFIRANDDLDRDQYALKVNRWMVTDGAPRFKNHSLMWAMASQVNVGAKK